MTELEKIVKTRYEELGWTVYSSGWPDLLCVRSGEIRAVEVKGYRDAFRGNQSDVLIALSQYIPVRTAHPGSPYDAESRIAAGHCSMCFAPFQAGSFRCTEHAHEADSRDFHLLVVEPDMRKNALELFPLRVGTKKL